MKLNLIKNFISESKAKEILKLVNNLKTKDQSLHNEHISSVRSELKGESYMYDISKSEASSYLASFQSSENIQDSNTLPSEIIELSDYIAESVGIPSVNKFLQIIVQKSGGKIKKHYDSSYPGFVNYKCNLAVLSENYNMYVDKVKVNISQGDLYCFEASLYPHWSDRFQEDRVLLSYGFAIPYNELGLSADDPRVRLSERIYRMFQKV
jgi:hypothetical protein